MRIRPSWILAATLFAAAGGVAIGTAVGGAEEARPSAARAATAPPPPPRVGLASGPARLALPSGWQPLGRHATLPGLEAATEVQAPHSTVALDIRAPEHPSLLPRKVAALFDGQVPAPELTRLPARSAWGYELPAPEPDERVAALTLPTTDGVVTIACAAPAAEIDLAVDDCATAMAALRLEGAAALPPSPRTAVRIALPAVVERLNAERRPARKRLAATSSPLRRRSAALDLAYAYRRAAARLRPLAAGGAVRLVATLAALDAKHVTLARASAQRRARAARRAGARIARGERRLGRQLARMDA